ncbi:FAD-dependent oxidoreductase [bacterium]|nr:FAD-dependent oxidoreductase [bacterium]
MRTVLLLSIAALSCFLSILSPATTEAQSPAEVIKKDVVVYGGTPGGIAAAIAAKRDGATVILLEQTPHVGGMSTSGLNRDEAEHMDRATFGGLYETFSREAATRSGTNPNVRGPRIWQSHIAEEVFLDMLKAAEVPVRYEQLIEGVTKKGSRLESLTVRGGTQYQAKVFVDATYEGDLMAAAGVSYHVGREAKKTYGESLAGVRYLDPPVKVSPYDESGSLLPGVMPGKPPAEFAESPVPICYNVRLNLTSDPKNLVPIEKPEGYDPRNHELLARTIESGHIKNIGQVLALYGLPNGKRECNNRQFSFVSMSMPGEQTAWAEATFEQREAIHKRFRDYTHGMLWFLKTDKRVPADMRNDMARYGFCKDEWQDNNHWPWYLYIRAARRMQGEYILTQADVTEDREKSDVVHIGSHFIDSHHVARYAVDESSFINEGRIWQKGKRFHIPYRAIVPKEQECENLIVPVCVSASNVAFCAIRLEPTWMHLGEVSGMAAALAAKNGKPIQSVDVKVLQDKLKAQGIPTDLPMPEPPPSQTVKKTMDAWVDEFFQSSDSDRDGLVSSTEWDRSKPDWKWLFAIIDKDKTRQIDRDEYMAFQVYKKQHPDWHKNLKAASGP